MKVFINGHEISIFQGATVGDVVLAYSTKSHKMLKNGFLQVTDRLGYVTEPDGPVREGQRFSLKRTKP